MKTGDTTTEASVQEIRAGEGAANLLYLEASPTGACGLRHCTNWQYAPTSLQNDTASSLMK
ncbi:hypothetical protein ACHAWO_001684 [Cyclotella atomus]|uniref:Uncharacterized protein n=1 Tax=Cyclotella atomus TaxID=382360 RepID=A0ABD3Q5R4_9STRA